MTAGAEVLPAREAFTLLLGLGALAALTAFAIAAFLPGRDRPADPERPEPLPTAPDQRADPSEDDGTGRDQAREHPSGLR
jgi:hypothetical protein